MVQATRAQCLLDVFANGPYRGLWWPVPTYQVLDFVMHRHHARIIALAVRNGQRAHPPAQGVSDNARMEANGIITLALAVIGAVLGVFNAWRSWINDRVRIRLDIS